LINIAVPAHRDDIASRMGMWLFLFTELLLFGGLFFIYSVYRFTHQTDFHVAAKELNVFIGTLNTVILLTSSLTMALSITAIQRKNRNLSVFLQCITILLGIIFLVNKYFEVESPPICLNLKEVKTSMKYPKEEYLKGHKNS